MIGINNEWPIPVLNITKGDRVVVNMYNGVGEPQVENHKRIC
jgi:iron transport multicopper oxidase